MKFQCVRSSESKGNTAFWRCSAERLLRNAVAALAIELDERSDATTAPVTAAIAHTVTRIRRGDRSNLMEVLPEGTILQFTSYNSQFTKARDLCLHDQLGKAISRSAWSIFRSRSFRPPMPAPR